MLTNPKYRALVQQVHIGVSVAAAGRMVGIKQPHKIMKKPEAQAYLLSLQADSEAKFGIKRDEVLQGFKDAVTQASILGDTQAQIAGWREIGRMMGFYEPETKRLILSTEEENRRRQLETMDEKKLLEMAGDTMVIDGEFDLLDQLTEGEAA
jgi:hypothetical protein